ncbi:MAG TPA: hypothetical protein PK668_19505 [Myxococcota bacterium]|nr:hypothetical protein [Myxococcota bacterium]HRY95081.1 hypothetical protein [Myxococcota bacterium]HSA24482.1 hypothetical protein [Myxococcota bacterium]
MGGRRLKSHWGWHALGGASVAGWLWVLAVMLWPVPDSEAGALLGPAELSGAIRPGEWWLGAYRDGRKIGWFHTRVELAAHGSSLTQESQVLVKVGGFSQAMDSRLAVRLDPAGRLLDLDFGLQAGPVSVSARGRMDQAGLALELDLGGQRSASRLALAEAPLFDLALPYAILARDPQAGDRFRAVVFDPQTLSNRETTIEVVGPDALSLGGAMRPAYHLRRSAAGLTMDSWIDVGGAVLKEELPGGLVLQREDADWVKRGVEGLVAPPGGLPPLWPELDLGGEGGRRTP